MICNCCGQNIKELPDDTRKIFPKYLPITNKRFTEAQKQGVYALKSLQCTFCGEWFHLVSPLGEDKFYCSWCGKPQAI